MKKSIRQRVSHFIETVSVSEIVEKTGLKQANLYRVVKGGNFGVDILEKIFEAYPNLNESWIIKGHGEMWSDSITVENSTKVEINEPQVIYGHKPQAEGLLESMLRRIKDLEDKI